MTDETSPSEGAADPAGGGGSGDAGDATHAHVTPAWRRPPTRRSRRVAVGAALVAVGVLVGGTVAAAQGDGGADAASSGADELSGHHTDHGDLAAGPAAGDEDPLATTVGSDDPAGEGTHHRRGRGAGHAHEPLAPYDERYDAASADERAAADALVAGTRATLAAYEDVDDAVAAGYRTRRVPQGLFAHYLDRSVAEAGHLLDPARPNGLVYYTGGDGDPVLLGAYFVAPSGVEVPATAGDLVVWHSHNPGCPGFFATEADPCTEVRRMVHVWTVGQVELTAPRTGETLTVEVTDPFGAPFRASVDRVG